MYSGAGDGLLDTLSPREREVLQLVGACYSNGQIAHMLNLAIRTVERHIGRIRDKLGILDSDIFSRRALLVRAADRLAEHDPAVRWASNIVPFEMSYA